MQNNETNFTQFSTAEEAKSGYLRRDALLDYFESSHVVTCEWLCVLNLRILHTVTGYSFVVVKLGVMKCLPQCLSLNCQFCARAHTHTHTCAHAHIHTCTHTPARARACTHIIIIIIINLSKKIGDMPLSLIEVSLF